jgi:Rieske Fe-S protein
VSAGKTSDLAVGSIVPVGSAPVFLARDAKGLYAMTTTCTHAGCDMGSEGRIASGRITCRCHGSEFDANGAVLAGPAQSALVHFAVSVDSQGSITIHGGTTVGADTRVPV